MLKLSLTISLLLASIGVWAKVLQPGFDLQEYTECLKMASNFHYNYAEDKYLCEKPEQYKRLYYSPEVGFDNAWELWQSIDGQVAVVSIRGSIPTQKSWFSNFHAGVVKANGTINMGGIRNYTLTADTLAYVHVGWLCGMLAMADDMHAKIDSCYKAGIRDIIFTGHSQGGAITFLATAYFKRMQETGKLAKDIQIKTYCSAAPKPGDYAFALQFERYMRGGWAYNVVNADDWVPETPLSVQTPLEFRPTNPFAQVEDLLSGSNMKAIDRLKIKILFKQLNKQTHKGEKVLTKYLGNAIGGMLEKMGTGYVKPELEHIANFQRAGDAIVLMPNEEYHKMHPSVSADAFEHHMFKAYMDLIKLDY